eukprot:2918661-Prymnesium_polylepis.1
MLREKCSRACNRHPRHAAAADAARHTAERTESTSATCRATQCASESTAAAHRAAQRAKQSAAAEPSGRCASAAAPYRPLRSGKHAPSGPHAQPDAQHAVQRAHQPSTICQPAGQSSKLPQAGCPPCSHLEDAISLLPQLRHDELSCDWRPHSRECSGPRRSARVAGVRADAAAIMPGAPRGSR